jgi:hypothetical protein
MAREPQYGVTVNGWERLLISLETNSQDLPHLEAHRLLLAGMVTQVRQISAQQAALAASKQDATQRLQALLVEGRKLATFLRAGIRQQYGNRSEKLVEFDLQPFRARTRPAPADTKPVPTNPTAPPATPTTPDSTT